MIGLPLTVVAMHFLGRTGCENHWIFWIDAPYATILSLPRLPGAA
jgi:hypothetical protein